MQKRAHTRQNKSICAYNESSVLKLALIFFFLHSLQYVDIKNYNRDKNHGYNEFDF